MSNKINFEQLSKHFPQEIILGITEEEISENVNIDINDISKNIEEEIPLSEIPDISISDVSKHIEEQVSISGIPDISISDVSKHIEEIPEIVFEDISIHIEEPEEEPEEEIPETVIEDISITNILKQVEEPKEEILVPEELTGKIIFDEEIPNTQEKLENIKEVEKILKEVEKKKPKKQKITEPKEAKASLNFIGERAEHPKKAKINDMYRNTTLGTVFLYDGKKWQFLVSDGEKGNNSVGSGVGPGEAREIAQDVVNNNPATSGISDYEHNKRKMELDFNTSYDSQYKVFSYSGNLVSAIDIWTDSSQTTKLYSKSLYYTGSLVTSSTMIDNINSITQTKVFTYSGNNITNMTETYS